MFEAIEAFLRHGAIGGAVIGSSNEVALLSGRQFEERQSH
jgi:hypothetical protein